MVSLFTLWHVKILEGSVKRKTEGRPLAIANNVPQHALHDVSSCLPDIATSKSRTTIEIIWIKPRNHDRTLELFFVWRSKRKKQSELRKQKVKGKASKAKSKRQTEKKKAK